MISGRRYYRRHHHHLNVYQSAPGLATRQRRAAYVRKTTQLLQWQNTTVTIKDVEYTLDRLLGHGGQGAVYASTREDGEQFALKMFVWEESTLTQRRLQHPSAESFLRELEYMMELKPISKHFVEFYDVDINKFSGLVVCFIVMELGTGDLSQMIKQMANRKAHHTTPQGGNTYIHSRDRKFVWRQIVACVKSLHDKNIVNTDLKPGNFITFGNKIKLSDLGLALPTNEPGQHYQGGVGTPTYSAPEVMHPEYYSPKGNQVSRKADIWSLGVILYFMTYGQTPAPTNQYEIGYSDASAPPPGKRPTRDRCLQDILSLTLQMNPANRPNIMQLQRHLYTRSNV